MFSLKTSMLKNIDVFQTSPNTNFPPIILHSYHVLHSRISGLCSVYMVFGSHTWFVYIQFLITISSPFTPWSKIRTQNYR